ncbi:hypothetical protein COCON_G00112650 [Conger conger]|uniref:Uncharacterized protein n=1 Tax=Conger conger TaxID=82655 RepID=A0A9Q1DK56_CONCO|nr:hypothetical protein COCON_G00112650 [Conger conger]
MREPVQYSEGVRVFRKCSLVATSSPVRAIKERVNQIAISSLLVVIRKQSVWCDAPGPHTRILKKTSR